MEDRISPDQDQQTKSKPLVDLLLRLGNLDAEQDWARLISWQKPYFQNTCRRRLERDDLVDDCVQDAFLEVRQRVGNFCGGSESQAQAWLLKIADHVALNMLRSETARYRRERKAGTEHHKDQDETPDNEEQLSILRRAILNLPESQRRVIELRYIYGMSAKQVADHLGLTINNVHQILNRAMKALRQRLRRGSSTITLLLGMSSLQQAWPDLGYGTAISKIVATPSTASAVTTNSGLASLKAWGLVAPLLVTSITAGSITAYTLTDLQQEETPAPLPAPALNLPPADLAPRIIQQPQHSRTDYLKPVTFSVTANGHPAPQYQWQRLDYSRDRRKKNNWRNIRGANGPSYTLAKPTNKDEEANFRCVISNRVGSQTTEARYLNVLTPFKGPPAIDAVVGQPYRYRFDSLMPEDMRYLSVYHPDEWLTQDEQLLSGTPTKAGSYPIRISFRTKRRDGSTGNRVTQRFTIGVREPDNQAPVITHTAIVPAVVTGTQAEFQVDAKDDQGQAGLRYLWSSPVDHQTRPSLITSNATDQQATRRTITFRRAGTYTFRATVVDEGHARSFKDATVTVKQVLSSLMIDSGQDSVRSGTSVALGLIALDQFKQSMPVPTDLRWSLVSGPASLTDTGILTVAKDSIGQHVVIAASNADHEIRKTLSIQ